jgi:hypothetical protein
MTGKRIKCRIGTVPAIVPSHGVAQGTQVTGMNPPNSTRTQRESIMDQVQSSERKEGTGTGTMGKRYKEKTCQTTTLDLSFRLGFNGKEWLMLQEGEVTCHPPQMGGK